VLPRSLKLHANRDPLDGSLCFNVDYDVNSSFIDCFTFSNLTHFDIRVTSSPVIFKTASCISSSKVSGYNESDCTDSEVIKCLVAALETSSVRILILNDNKFRRRR
jgi:hypothetical protein